MLITESQMNIGRSSSTMNLLDRMSYLTEAESTYAPAMVPVVENTSLQANVVRLEDIVSFAESNGIEDLGYAVQLVCEASQIDPSSIAFSVQEDTLIADSDMASLASDIMNEGVRIAAVPVSDSHPAAQIVNEAMNYFLETGDDFILDYLCEEVKTATGGMQSRMNAGMTARDAYAASAAEAKYNAAKGDEAAKLKAGTDAGNSIVSQQKKAEGLMAKIKKYANKGRDFIAKYIAKLHDWAKKINEEMTKVDPEKRTILQSIKKKVTGAIAWLTARLSKIGTEGGGHRREDPEYWKKDEKKEASK